MALLRICPSAARRRGEVGEVVEDRPWLESRGEVLVHDHLDDVGRDVFGQTLAVLYVEPGVPEGDGAGDELDDAREQPICRPRAVRPRGPVAMGKVAVSPAGFDDCCD